MGSQVNGLGGGEVSWVPAEDVEVVGGGIASSGNSRAIAAEASLQNVLWHDHIVGGGISEGTAHARIEPEGGLVGGKEVRFWVISVHGGDGATSEGAYSHVVEVALNESNVVVGQHHHEQEDCNQAAIQHLK